MNSAASEPTTSLHERILSYLNRTVTRFANWRSRKQTRRTDYNKRGGRRHGRCFSACHSYDKSIKGRQYELAMCRGNTLINGVKPFPRRRNRREGSGSNKPIKEETS